MDQSTYHFQVSGEGSTLLVVGSVCAGDTQKTIQYKFSPRLTPKGHDDSEDDCPCMVEQVRYFCLKAVFANAVWFT